MMLDGDRGVVKIPGAARRGSRQTVRVHLHRALRKLGREMKAYLG